MRKITRERFLNATAAAILLVGFSSAHAETITDGFTFSVASGADPTVGTHFHSSTGGDFGNPAGKAEVGNFDIEEVRGLSEYNLDGLTSATSAFVTFEVFNLGGLFEGVNDFPFAGSIDVFTYVGNNLEDVSDYEAPTGSLLGSFNTSNLSVGDVLSFDITAEFNAAVDATLPSLGVRLQLSTGTLTDGGALTFDSFRLTTDNQTSVVPVPAAVWLLGTALLGLAGFTRHKKTV